MLMLLRCLFVSLIQIGWSADRLIGQHIQRWLVVPGLSAVGLKKYILINNFVFSDCVNNHKVK